MIKEAFTEIDDCSFYSSFYLNENNKNNNNNNNIFINYNNYNFKIEEKNDENFLNKKKKNYLIM